MSINTSLADFFRYPELDHGEEYPEEPCTSMLVRQEFFHSDADSVYLFIKLSRSFFGDDGKIVGKKFGYFPVVTPRNSQGLVDALWCWPTDLVFRLDGESFLPKVGDEFSYYGWPGFEEEADRMKCRKILAVNLFAAQQEDKVHVFVKIATEPFEL